MLGRATNPNIPFYAQAGLQEYPRSGRQISNFALVQWCVISTGRRNTCIKPVCWRFKLQCLSGSLVQLARDLVEAAL